MPKTYDVGIYGLWYGRNYGSMATYFALDDVIRDLGYSVVMIDNPLRREAFNVADLPSSHPLRFAEGRYAITSLYRLERMNELNKYCRAFVLGSDQMWNYTLSKHYQQSYFFDFVDDDHPKISYGTSFGRAPYNGPEEEKVKIRKNLSRFDAVSVRDVFSKQIAEQEFGVSVQQVLDPVFLCPRDAYDDLIDEISDRQLPENFIFVYLLDPSPEYGKALQAIADHSDKHILIAFDEPANKKRYYERLKIDDERISFLVDPPLAQWLACFRSADYVLTDSFHGACFSVIFEKDFIVLRNDKRGGARFQSLLGDIGLDNRIIGRAADFAEKFKAEFPQVKIDYEVVRPKLKALVEHGKEWLAGALAPLKDNRH